MWEHEHGGRPTLTKATRDAKPSPFGHRQLRNPTSASEASTSFLGASPGTVIGDSCNQTTTSMNTEPKITEITSCEMQRHVGSRRHGRSEAPHRKLTLRNLGTVVYRWAVKIPQLCYFMRRLVACVINWSLWFSDRDFSMALTCFPLAHDRGQRSGSSVLSAISQSTSLM